MKRLIASFAVLGLVAAPAFATTKAPATQAAAPVKAKSQKVKHTAKAAKVKAAPSSSKASN